MGRRSKDDKRQIKRWKGIVNRFKGKLIEMIKDAGSEFIIILFHLKLDRFYCIYEWLKWLMRLFLLLV